MQKIFVLLIVMSAVLSACVVQEAPSTQDRGGLVDPPAQHRRIIGDLCSPRLATKGFC